MNHEFNADEKRIDGLKEDTSNSGINTHQKAFSFSESHLYPQIKDLAVELHSLTALVNKLATPMREPREQEWITSSQVMVMLQISKRTLQNYRDTGLLAFSRLGGKYYYLVKDIRALLEKEYRTRRIGKLNK